MRPVEKVAELLKVEAPAKRNRSQSNFLGVPGAGLKPAKSMEWMKQDMAGAAAVLGMMQAVSIVAPAVEVHGFVATAENMPGAKAQKPGDVIEYRNGTTAEVTTISAQKDQKEMPRMMVAMSLSFTKATSTPSM